jgi:hypothetical protein
MRMKRRSRSAAVAQKSGIIRNQMEAVMPNFLFVYRNQSDALGKLSPEDMQRQLQRWQAWIGEGIRKGWMINPGDGLTKEGRIVNAKKLVADGPFVEAREVVGGFSVVKASNIDEAAVVAKDCPALLIGGTVEVRPLAGYKATE